MFSPHYADWPLVVIVVLQIVWIYEYIQRQNRVNANVGSVDHLPNAQVDRDTGNYVSLFASQAASPLYVVNHFN